MHAGNCSNFPVLGVYTSVPTSDYAAWGLVCLPYSQAIEDLRTSFDLERPGDTNNNTTTTAFNMEAALARVNVCEGRQVAPGRIVKSGNGIDLTISAPCTCLPAVGETPACTGIKVQDDAKAQCDDCKNVRPIPLPTCPATHTTTHDASQGDPTLCWPDRPELSRPLAHVQRPYDCTRDPHAHGVHTISTCWDCCALWPACMCRVLCVRSLRRSALRLPVPGALTVPTPGQGASPERVSAEARTGAGAVSTLLVLAPLRACQPGHRPHRRSPCDVA